jgi:hypothetical protein
MLPVNFTRIILQITPALLTCVGHGQDAGPVVSQRGPELVLKLATPDGLAASAVTCSTTGT